MNFRIYKEKFVITLFIFAVVVFTVEHGHVDDSKVVPADEYNEMEDIVAGRGSGANDNFHSMPDMKNPPTLDANDIVYKTSRNTVPVVNEEYNLVFFLTAKAASSEWIRFLMRLQGSEHWCEDGIHPKGMNDLTFLSDYSIEEAQEMMTSPKWNRAIFVRNPKPRILSAFLDKAVQHEKHFLRSNCPLWASETAARGGTLEECVEKHDSFEFFLYNITTTLNLNVHWRSIYSRVDSKWWPYINYIAHMQDLSEDAEHFLKSIHSNVDGVSAWDRIGKTGWSDNERDCDNIGNSAFLAKKDTLHQTSARDKMLQYYTPELERFVETHYADDFNNPFFHFSELKLFPEDDVMGGE
jgi:hypothetical protein